MKPFYLVSFFTFCILSTFVYSERHFGAYVEPTDLGKGFDSQFNVLRSSCITGDWVELGNNQASMSYVGSHTYKQRIEETFGKVKGGVNLILFSGSVSTSLTTRTTENDTTAASAIKLSYQAKDLTLENRRLTPLAESLSGQSQQVIFDQCGDEFIHHIKQGSELYVVTRLHFRTKEEYEKWVTKIKIRVLFVKKTKTFTKEWYDLTKNAVYSVNVVTRGGYTDRLGDILSTGTTYCKTENLQPCIDTTDRLFAYLLDDNGYSDDLNQSNLNTLSFSTESYKNSGHFTLDTSQPPMVDPGFALQEERLNLYLARNHQLLESLKAFHSVETDAAKKQVYASKIGLAQENIDALDIAALNCRTSNEFNPCRNAVDNAVTSLHIITI